MNEYIDPRSRLARMGRHDDDRSPIADRVQGLCARY